MQAQARAEAGVQAQLFGALVIDPDFHKLALNIATVEQVPKDDLFVAKLVFACANKQSRSHQGLVLQQDGA